MSADSATQRQTQLLDEWSASRARELFDRMDVFEHSIEVFHRNYEALASAVNANVVDNIDELEQFLEDFDTIRKEITRHLHNCLAAAHALVDHTRVFYREVYQPNNLMPDYSAQIQERFLDEPVVAFVKCLRQFCQHYRAPFVSTHIEINADRDPPEFGTTLALSKCDLLDFSSWNSPAKKFLDGASDDITLLDVLADYRGKLVDFYEWFRQQQRVAHKEEFEYRDRVLKELTTLNESNA